MSLAELILQIQNNPELVDFNSVISTIDSEYQYTPSKFTNGVGQDVVINESSTNEGSCKIFAFAQLNNLTKQQALACFGKYYREDVLKNPEGTDHANIRTLIKYDLNDIKFDNNVLIKKN